MGARAAEVETGERHPVPPQAVQRPPGKPLVETRLGVQRVALGRAVVALQVEGRDDLPGLDQATDSRRVCLQRADDRVAQLLAVLVPRTGPQIVWRALDDDAHHVTRG